MGKADQQKTFAEGLHLPLGFELASEGVYVSQSTNLILLSDTDGDDLADRKEVLLSGFDNHDSHHGISAFVLTLVEEFIWRKVFFYIQMLKLPMDR